MRRFALLVLLMTAACTSPTAPDAPLASERWSLSAEATGDGVACSLAGELQLSGTVENFSGSANIGSSHTDPVCTFDTSYHGIEVVGDADGVSVGPYYLNLADSSANRMAGTWECGEASGEWEMRAH